MIEGIAEASQICGGGQIHEYVEPPACSFTVPPASATHVQRTQLRTVGRVMTPAEKLGHRARANRVHTAIGPAWQASCSCGWEGHRYYTKGASETARAERWSHEISVEDGLVAPTRM